MSWPEIPVELIVFSLLVDQHALHVKKLGVEFSRHVIRGTPEIYHSLCFRSRSFDKKDVKVKSRFAPLKLPTRKVTEVSSIIEKPFQIILLDSRNPHRF